MTNGCLVSVILMSTKMKLAWSRDKRSERGLEKTENIGQLNEQMPEFV